MAIEIIPEKICPHCEGTKWIITYEKKLPTSKTIRKRVRCSVLAYERASKWHKNNPYSYTRKPSLPKPDGYWRTDKKKEYYRLKAKKESLELSDNHVKNSIRKSLIKKDIDVTNFFVNKEQIEEYRKIILINRQLTILKNQQNELPRINN